MPGLRPTTSPGDGLTGLAASAFIKMDHAALYATNGDLIYLAKARTVGGVVRRGVFAFCGAMNQQGQLLTCDDKSVASLA